MRKDRRAKLESIGFRFGQAKKSDSWETFFEELRDYLRNHGDCNVPEKYRLNPSLGEWVRKQRHDYSLKCGGDQGAMAAEHEAKLNALGFSWVKKHSPAGSNGNSKVLCPDEVASERLTPMNRQRAILGISTEVRSNEYYEEETSSPAAGLKKRKVGHLGAITNDESLRSLQGSLDIIVNKAVMKWLGENDVVCRNGRVVIPYP
jgi:hypothetical protein